MNKLYSIVRLDGSVVIHQVNIQYSHYPNDRQFVWMEYKLPEYDSDLYDCVPKEIQDPTKDVIQFDLTMKDESTVANVLKSRLTKAVQDHMDVTANQYGYDNIFTACTYANSNNLTFKNQSLAFISWRDSVWEYCFTVLADVQNQLRTIPSESDLISELPLFVGV